MFSKRTLKQVTSFTRQTVDVLSVPHRSTAGNKIHATHGRIAVGLSKG